MGNGPGTLVEVAVGDDPAGWASIGFTVDDHGLCRVGAVRIRLVGADDERGRGIVGWTLAGCTITGQDIDGLPTADLDPSPGAGAGTVDRGRHANGVTQIDHLVVITPDLDRTTAAIEAAGIAARRTREAGHGRRQRFFRMGEVILEVVGPVARAGGGPATFWGFAFTVADIGATAEHLAGRIGEPKPAVQAGRRIATLRSGDEVSVPVAFMSAPGPGAPGRTGDAPR
jgi:hypothetical protein